MPTSVPPRFLILPATITVSTLRASMPSATALVMSLTA